MGTFLLVLYPRQPRQQFYLAHIKAPKSFRLTLPASFGLLASHGDVPGIPAGVLRSLDADLPPISALLPNSPFSLSHRPGTPMAAGCLKLAGERTHSCFL